VNDVDTFNAYATRGKKQEPGMSKNPVVPASSPIGRRKTVDEVTRTGPAPDHAVHQAAVMGLYRADECRLLPTPKAGSDKRLSVWMSILVIAGCSVLSWALVISIAMALLRFGS
jgi:hypothetical protein